MLRSPASGVAACALLLATSAGRALAQGEPKTMRLEGAPSQTGTGALRCVPNESAQLGLRALDENLNRVLVADYAPQARSTDESVVVARVTDNAASTVNVLCVGDGEAWITVEAAGLRADMPVLVGTARRKATPRGPHPELAGVAASNGATAAPGQPVGQPVVASAPPAATVAPASAPSAPSTAVSTAAVSNAAVTPASVQTASASPMAASPSSAPLTSAPLANPADSPARATVSTAARTGPIAGAPSVASRVAEREPSAVGGSAGALSAPTGVTAAYVGDGRVAVGWSAVPGASLYSVLYRDRSSSNWYAATRQPIAATEFVSDPVNELMVPAGAIEFAVVPQRDAQDWSGSRSTPAAVNVPRYSGRYRVTVNGFRVLHETLDTPLNGDGQHDEVYVRVAYREYDADGNAVGAEGHAQTHTHGDINAPRWRQAGAPAFRYAAGSATNLGGLITGNGYPSQQSPWVAPPTLSNETFPLFVWEGFLMEGQSSVAIVPAIYEDDESGWERNPEMKALVDIGTWVGARAYKEVQTTVGPVAKRIVQRPKLVVQKTPGT
jgi:hypothetical protein